MESPESPESFRFTDKLMDQLSNLQQVMASQCHNS